jgi:hypothetical protein
MRPPFVGAPMNLSRSDGTCSGSIEVRLSLLSAGPERGSRAAAAQMLAQLGG